MAPPPVEENNSESTPGDETESLLTPQNRFMQRNSAGSLNSVRCHSLRMDKASHFGVSCAVVNLWNLHDFSCKVTVPTYEALEAVAVCLFEQKSSDVVVSSDKDEVKRGIISAMMLPSDQGLLCVTADQQFLFNTPVEDPEGSLQLTLSKRLIGYNEEIADMKFLGDEEQFLAVSTSVEHGY